MLWLGCFDGTKLGYLNERGQPFAAKSIKSMLEQ
jgi:hypothetical protein